MKIVVSVCNYDEIERAVDFRADIIELRLDLLQKPHAALSLSARLPRILTLRSRAEGGAFVGDPSAWAEQVLPLVRRGDWVDVEERFSCFAPALRSRGIRIIGSAHHTSMLSDAELVATGQRLRAYSDIPKIIVTPATEQDLLTLCSFTLGSAKPICTGVMGKQFAYGRILLPFFGSSLVYCHAGTPAAEGQYHIRDFRTILDLMTGTAGPK
jgi:3-dehydroquinate dehydratase I